MFNCLSCKPKNSGHKGKRSMEFTLYYRGPLKSNGGITEKHQLRRAIHKQLKELWNQKPLSGCHEDMLDKKSKDQSLNILKSVGGFEFAPLACKKNSFIVELSIFILRLEPPGSIVLNSGDIDNRLKTLFDALRMPSVGELPKDVLPDSGETPFFCLLEDDALITKVSVATDRLLEAGLEKSEVVLHMHVVIKAIEKYWGTIGIV